MSDPVFVTDLPGRYQLMLDGAEVGFIEYDPVGDKSVLIKHAEVSTQHEGKGFGSLLVRRALEHVQAAGKTVIPICPYTLNFLRRHPEYHAVVREDMRKTL